MGERVHGSNVTSERFCARKPKKTTQWVCTRARIWKSVLICEVMYSSGGKKEIEVQRSTEALYRPFLDLFGRRLGRGREGAGLYSGGYRTRCEKNPIGNSLSRIRPSIHVSRKLFTYNSCHMVFITIHLTGFLNMLTVAPMRGIYLHLKSVLQHSCFLH